MSLKVEKVDTWAASVTDAPGRIATLLSTLSKSGVNLELVLARRSQERPGTGVILVRPIEGAAAVRAAHEAGFRKTIYLHTVRVEGPDKPGEGQRVIGALAKEGLNLSGLSAAVVDHKYVAHLALDTEADAERALAVLQKL